MTINSASITGVSFNANVCRSIISPFTDLTAIKLPISFDSVSHLEIISGSFTPNNNYLYILQNIPTAAAPNFMILCCDNPVSLTITAPINVASHSFVKFGFLSWAPEGGNLVNGIFIDGRISPNPYVTPMTQGLTANYTFVIGQATIS